MTIAAGESKKLLFQEKNNKGEHPLSLEQFLNAFLLSPDPVLQLCSKNSKSSPILASTTDQHLSSSLSVASNR